MSLPPDDLVERSRTHALQRFAPRALLLFGSWLSPSTRRATSIPDLFALVDDVDEALRRTGASFATRRAARVLPPTTLSLRDDDDRELAKLNLIDPPALARELSTVPDLYVAGRLSKRTVLLHAADPAAITALLDEATRVIVRAALLSPPRRLPLAAAAQRCFDLSYQAEWRPETAARREALFRAFAEGYEARFGAFIKEHAAAIGLHLEGDLLVDDRPDSIRETEAAQRRRLLRRGRLRSAARWPKQMLVYRGWLPYVIGKARRARA